MTNVVVVGGGLAAAKAVERLRELGFSDPVTIVADEKHLPYERPPLSKDLLLGKDADPTVWPAGWYDEHDVRLRTGVTASTLDLSSGRVGLDTGEWLPFDRLLLATGAEPRVPDIPGAERALYLRTLEDVDGVLAALAPGQRLAIVGAGWIGLEVAAAARLREAEVTVLEMAALPLEKVLGATLARHLADLHLRHGVDLRTDVTVGEIVLDDDRPVGVRTTDGVVPADHVLVAVGAVPNTSLAEAAGLTVDDGIVVDEHFTTSDPRVLAIGDVADAYNSALGTRLRVEHWDNAIRQGRAAAEVIAGGDAGYDWQPYFYTDQFEFSIEYVGHGSAEDDVEIRGDLDGDEFIAYWLDGDRVTAAMNVGIWDVNDRLREIVGTRAGRDDLTDLS